MMFQPKATKIVLMSSLLVLSAALAVQAAEPKGEAKAAPKAAPKTVQNELPPEFDNSLAGGIPGWVVGNVRSVENKTKDVYQHPFMMTVVFGGLTQRMSLVEVLAVDAYWAEMLGGVLAAGNGRGHFIQAVDADEKGVMAQMNANKDMLLKAASERIEVVPLSYDSLVPEGSADMVLLSKKMGKLMAAGNLEKLLASANKALKAGGILLVEDYRAKGDKPQDPKAANKYIREDYAIAAIQKAGFKLDKREDKLLANPADKREIAADNSDRFLLKFVK